MSPELSPEYLNPIWRQRIKEVWPGMRNRLSIEELARLSQTLLHRRTQIGELVMTAVLSASLVLSVSDQRFRDPSTLLATEPASTASERACIFPASQDVQSYLDYYSNCDIARLFRDPRKYAVVASLEPVSMRVLTPLGIWIRDFPDARRARSRFISTNGPATGPTYKALYWGEKIEGEFSSFVFEHDPETGQLVNIWAVRFSKEGGWPFYGQPHVEFFSVGGADGSGGIKYHVSFRTGNGAISGEDLFPRPT